MGRTAVSEARPLKAGGELALVIGGVALGFLLVLQPAFLSLAAAAVLVFVAIFKFDFFMYSMIAILPWYPLLDAKLPLTDIMLFLRCAMFGGVFVRVRGRGSVAEWLWGSRLKKAVLFFAFVLLASLLLSSLRTNLESYRSLRRLLGYLLVFYSVLGWMDGKARLEKVVRTILCSTIAVALFGFVQFLVGDYTDFYLRLYPFQEGVMEAWVGRITSFLYHYNSLAGYLNLVLPFALGVLVALREGTLKWTGFFTLSLGLTALVLTGSRGGMLAALGVFVLAVLKLAPRRVTLFWIVASMVLALSVLLLLREGAAGLQAYTGVERLQDVDEFTQLSRFALWGAAFLMFRSNMLIGTGYGTFRYLYNDYIPGIPGGQLDSHNFYLQTLAETGLIGFFAFFLMLYGFFRRGYALIREDDPVYRIVGIGVCGAIVGFLIHGFVDFLFIVSPQFGAMFWLVMALGLSAFENCTSGQMPAATTV